MNEISSVTKGLQDHKQLCEIVIKAGQPQMSVFAGKKC